MKAQLDGISIYFEPKGSGSPIIFLHGQSIDHRNLLDLMEPLFEQRRDWQRFYVDLPGHGQSEGPDWIENQDQILDVLLEFIDHVIPQQNFVLVGSSYGAYLARGIIYWRQAHVDGLMMIVPMILADRGKRDLPPHITLVEKQEVLSTLPVEDKSFFENVVVVQSEMALQQIKKVINPARESYDYDFMERLEANRAFSFQVDDLKAPFERPVLMLFGRQDSVVGYRDAWQLLEQYPRATFAVLDKAGHLLGIAEQVALSRSLINEWLDRLEAEAN